MNLLAPLFSGKAIAILIAAILLSVLIAVLKGSNRGRGNRSPIKQRNVLTKNEQPMYFRLKEALPEHVVLAQVAFSALLDTRERATRNTFDRKVADFVVCDRSFIAIAIIELDDASHRGKEREDSERDKLLTNAGYKVLRYKYVPNAETIRADLSKASRSIPVKTSFERVEPTV